MPVFVGMKGKLGGIGSWASRQASSLYKPSHEHQNLNFYFSLFFWQIFFDLSNFLKYQHGVSDSVSLVCSSMYSITFLCPIMLIRWIFIFGLFKKYFNFFGELIFLFMCYLQVCCWISKYLMQIQISLLLICSFNTTVGWEHILNNAIFHICYIVFDDPECGLSS